MDPKLLQSSKSLGAESKLDARHTVVSRGSVLKKHLNCVELGTYPAACSSGVQTVAPLFTQSGGMHSAKPLLGRESLLSAVRLGRGCSYLATAMPLGSQERGRSRPDASATDNTCRAATITRSAFSALR